MNDSCGVSEWGIMEEKKIQEEGQILDRKVCIYDNQTASVSILFTKI
jgi:hypothetical protein